MSFSEEMVERFRRAAYQGIDEPPQAMGLAGSLRQGRFVMIGLHFQEGRISRARFRSFNCLPAVAAADWLCETVEGQTGQPALSLTAEHIADALGGVPLRKMFCIELARAALLQAVTEAQKKGLLL